MVVGKPVIIQQPTAMAPFSQIRAGGGALFPPSETNITKELTTGRQPSFQPQPEPEVIISVTSPHHR